jgi:FixJ family two-component response regulator
MGNAVLLLDDDEDLLEAMSELIEVIAGRPVLRTRTVAELVSLEAQALACCVAILDINLGEGAPSGIDALRWLKARGFVGRIVFLTGHARTQPLVDEARRVADVDVLSKPLASEQFLALLEERPL